jgi:hypothetical protein
MDYSDREQLFYEQEKKRLGIKNDPEPEVCPKCGSDLEVHGGMVGEAMLVCPEHGPVWTDHEDALRRII